MLRFLLTLSCLAPSLTAQLVTATVPNLLAFVNVDLPFPAGIGRYQQWYSASALQASIAEPMRIQQLEFFAGTQPTSQAALIDCEVLMGHGLFSGVTGQFDSNWSGGWTIVKARANVQLSAGGPGATVITMPLSPLFTWDRVRPLLIEIRVYGNSLGNQPFSYNFRGTTQSLGVTTRVYAGGSPGATSGNTSQGVGMMTRFTARPGAIIGFGTGCAGEGGFVPVNFVQGIPWPGLNWSHTVSNAPSQRPAFWVLGDTNTAPYPVDLTAVLGYGSSNCFLRTNPVVVAGATTVGGGAGGGIANFSLQLPPTTGYIGVYLYSQWVVFDPLAANGVLCVTPGAWSIVAPVGG